MLASRAVCVGGHPKPAGEGRLKIGQWVGDFASCTRGVVPPGRDCGLRSPAGRLWVDRSPADRLAPSLALPGYGIPEGLRWGEGP